MKKLKRKEKNRTNEYKTTKNMINRMQTDFLTTFYNNNIFNLLS